MDALTFQHEAMQLEKLMYHVSWSLLRNSDDCADAVQEALTRAWQRRHTLRSMDRFKPWLMRILVNQCKDMLRRQKRRSFFPLEEAAADVAAADSPMELTEALSQLKPEWRMVIVLHYLEGCSVEEIAMMTGAPSGTVKSRLKSARHRLGVLLQEE
ncbi:MAG: RNA polymerase sigma factor [Clostridia bacterium]|nr:RNA polymerase sigma factor [Clostridia bacterium]